MPCHIKSQYRITSFTFFFQQLKLFYAFFFFIIKRLIDCQSLFLFWLLAINRSCIRALVPALLALIIHQDLALALVNNLQVLVLIIRLHVALVLIPTRLQAKENEQFSTNGAAAVGIACA